MKKWMILSLTGILSMTLAQAEQTKLYEVESGKISYEIKGSGNTMGVQTKSMGKKNLIFDAYGSQSLTEENKVEQSTVMGQAQTNKNHTMVYFKEGIMYLVDFDRKSIMRQENMAMMMGGNMAAKGKAMMKQMGGKQTGTDKVLGYTCEVWELMGVKQCLYKGIPLKIESNIMGIRNTETATKAEFDISVDEDNFKLPDFPIRDEMGASIDKSGLEKMDHRAQKDAQQAQAQMAAMMGAMANAGVQKGQTPSASQMEAMQQGMLPMAKQQMLSEESNIRETRTCLEDADSLKEAQQCQKKFGDTEEDDPLADWSPQTKKQTLKEIDQYLDVTIPCVKKAQSMNALEQCMM